MGVMPPTLTIIPVPGLPEVRPGDDLAQQIIDACGGSGGAGDGPPPGSGPGLEQHDVLVVSQKVVSKAEGKLVPVDPSDPQSHKPLVLAESVRVVRRRGDLIISETRHGFVCASAGIDRSNVAADVAALLPDDPDRSARRIRDAIAGRVGIQLAVIVADTFGRPWRRGLTDVAIGSAGILPVLDLRGTGDTFGRELQVTEVCIVDELAGAAELVRGKASGVAVAVIRGVDPAWFGEGGVLTDVVRHHSEDLFR
jgi:coenzyme F420-0:L-glutamate ligase/coenzyme F420-1:gamma-L-glutamate ligase